MSKPHIEDALKILKSLGLPRAQQNERSALCLLALLDLRPERKWAKAKNPLMGITPTMDWIREHYKKVYAPNSRETVRRQTMHQFVEAGIALYNPDKPDRPVNSPAAVYQVAPAALALLRSFGSKAWHNKLTAYLAKHQTLAAQYARERKQNLVPVQIAPGKEIALSPGEHSELIRAIVEDFGAPVSFQEAFSFMSAIRATNGAILTLCCWRNLESASNYTARCRTLFCTTRYAIGCC
jgi:hypothetical protein